MTQLVGLVQSALLLGQVGFLTHGAGLGITIGLPASWKPDSGISNQNGLVFRARDSVVPANSISINVTVSPAMQRNAFRSATPEELDGMVKKLCDRFVAQVKENGGAGRCLGHEVRTLEGRPVLVIQQEAVARTLGLENRRLVALFPSDGLLFTLSYSVNRADFDLGVARAILASLHLPT